MLDMPATLGPRVTPIPGNHTTGAARYEVMRFPACERNSSREGGLNVQKKKTNSHRR